MTVASAHQFYVFREGTFQALVQAAADGGQAPDNRSHLSRLQTVTSHQHSVYKSRTFSHTKHFLNYVAMAHGIAL